MRHLILAFALAALSGLAHGQAASAAAASDPVPPQEGVQRMRGMDGMSRMNGMNGMNGAAGMAHRRGAVCLYDGRAYSVGALLHANGVDPVLECVAPVGAAERQYAIDGPAWRVYRPAR